MILYRAVYYGGASESSDNISFGHLSSPSNFSLFMVHRISVAVDLFGNFKTNSVISPIKPLPRSRHRLITPSFVLSYYTHYVHYKIVCKLIRQVHNISTKSCQLTNTFFFSLENDTHYSIQDMTQQIWRFVISWICPVRDHQTHTHTHICQPNEPKNILECSLQRGNKNELQKKKKKHLHKPIYYYIACVKRIVRAVSNIDQCLDIYSLDTVDMYAREKKLFFFQQHRS